MRLCYHFHSQITYMNAGPGFEGTRMPGGPPKRSRVRKPGEPTAMNKADNKVVETYHELIMRFLARHVSTEALYLPRSSSELSSPFHYGRNHI